MDDLIRRFFGMGSGTRPRYNPKPNDSYEHPSEEDFRESKFFEHPGDSLDDMFEHFQQDMFLQMESLHRQMEDMFKGYGAMDFPSGDFSHPSIMPNDPVAEGSENKKIFTWSGPSPFFRRGLDNLPSKSPRDFMLKEKEKTEKPHSEADQPMIQNRPDPHVPKWDKFEPAKMEDTDLDGKLSDENVLALIRRPEGKRAPDVRVHPPQTRPGGFFSSQSVRISTFNGPDGKVEHKRVVRDSSGREESTVTRSIGDKSYSVTTVTDDSGAKEKHEKLQNMDEGELSKFEELWSKPRYEKSPSSPEDSMLSPRSAPGVAVDPHDQGLFYRLFGGKN
ncbi:myeloid leukemia factor 1 [Elysia marginata]|uniref:Myeloid leukemia factor 1 n=1 Tax=Elysia marginata TaxID=1093978 RepID=A0AAV4HI08_9GAST|nr:myeloid leukemia factor 1 [Elysia marginata]